VQERRRSLAGAGGRVREILTAGAAKARREAQATMNLVRAAMHLDRASS